VRPCLRQCGLEQAVKAPFTGHACRESAPDFADRHAHPADLITYVTDEQ
jgi:hypothetical protein